MVERIIQPFHLDYQPIDERKAQEVEWARDIGDWFERNKGMISDERWAEELGQKSAHYLARGFRDGHNAELAKIAITVLTPHLLEVEQRPELGPSFLHGMFREFRYVGLPYPEILSRKFS